MGDATKLSVSTGYETADSDWGRFLSCWVDRYSQTGRAGDPENTIVFGHTVPSLLTPDLERVEGRFGFALPKSLRDFLAIYNPDADWLEKRIAEGKSFMLPAGRLELLSSFDPMSYSIWYSTRIEEESDTEYHDYFINPAIIFPIMPHNAPTHA